MALFFMLLVIAGLFALVRLSNGLPGIRRAGILGVGLVLFFLGLPIAFELGRVSERYERDIAANLEAADRSAAD